jgi:hypothetical protein
MTAPVRGILIVSLLLPLSGAKTQPVASVLGGYYVHGSYSSATVSNTFSASLRVPVERVDALFACVERTGLSDLLWSYDQTLVLLGGIKNLYPFYATAMGGYLGGTYAPVVSAGMHTPILSVGGYSDRIWMGYVELKYNWDLFFFGVAHAYLSYGGWKEVTSNQTSLIATWLATPRITATVRPVLTGMSDRNRLLSVGGTIRFVPSPGFAFTGGCMVGKRAYFIDTEALSVFNQDYTQTAAYSIQGVLDFAPWGRILLGYQLVTFTAYDIAFITGGFQITL